MALTFTRISALLPFMRGYAPMCPDPILELAARAAAVEFCERTRCWRHVTTITITEAGGVDIVPSVASIHEIERAEANDVALIPTQHSEIQGEHEIAQPRWITQTNPQSVTVHPWPGEPVEVSLSLFLKPRFDIEVGLDPQNPLHDRFNVLPAWIVTQHGERIADGGLSRVLTQPQTRWFDPQLAAVHAARFEQAMSSHFRTNMRGQQRARVRTSYIDF